MQSGSPSTSRRHIPPFTPSPLGSHAKNFDPSTSIRRVLFSLDTTTHQPRSSSPAETSTRGAPSTSTKRSLYYGGDSDDSSDAEDELEAVDESDEDEEEVVWGVASTSRSPAKPPNALANSIGPVDPLEKYEAQHRSLAWQQSHQNSSVHSSRINSLLSPSSSASSSSPIRPIASSSRAQREEREMAEVRKMLEGMRVEREEEERRERSEFERRNKALWEGIESTITTSEQAHLLALRAKQQEAETKAAAMRAAAEKKAAEESKAAEAKRETAAAAAEEERKRVEEAERLEKEEREKGAGAGGLGGLEGKGQEFGVWVEKMKNIKENILPKVNSSPEWKKKCNAVKRQITPKIGQIVNSQPVILRITSEISLILHSAQTASPEIYIWILNHLSKILIKQAETEIASKPSATWPLARLVVGLMMMGHAEGLGEVLMSRMVKKCPWVVPFYPARKEGQTEAAHRKSLGHYPLSSTAPPESTYAHSTRMTGILTLYLSILSVSSLLPPPSTPSPANTFPLPPPPPSHPPYPSYTPSLLPMHFTLPAAWSWLAAILRPPLVGMEIVPGLVGAGLDMMGERCGLVYGKQWGKVMRAPGRELDEVGGKGGEGSVGGRERLRLGLERWAREGRWGDAEGWEVEM